MNKLFSLFLMTALFSVCVHADDKKNSFIRKYEVLFDEKVPSHVWNLLDEKSDSECGSSPTCTWNSPTDSSAPSCMYQTGCGGVKGGGGLNKIR